MMADLRVAPTGLVLAYRQNNIKEKADLRVAPTGLVLAYRQNNIKEKADLRVAPTGLGKLFPPHCKMEHISRLCKDYT